MASATQHFGHAPQVAEAFLSHGPAEGYVAGGFYAELAEEPRQRHDRRNIGSVVSCSGSAQSVAVNPRCYVGVHRKDRIDMRGKQEVDGGVLATREPEHAAALKRVYVPEARFREGRQQVFRSPGLLVCRRRGFGYLADPGDQGFLRGVYAVEEPGQERFVVLNELVDFRHGFTFLFSWR